MSGISNPVGLKLDDILTRVIPGAVPVFFVISILETFDLFKLTTTELTIAVILSFLVGEIIELFRYQAFSVPRSFQRLLYRKTRNIQHLGIIDTTKIRIYNYLFGDVPEYNTTSAFWSKEYWFCPIWSYWAIYSFEVDYDNDLVKELQESNPLPGEKIISSQLYYHLQKLVEDKLNKEARRRKTLSKFKSNLYISLFISIVIGSIYTIKNNNVIRFLYQLSTFEKLALLLAGILVLILVHIYYILMSKILNQFQSQHLADLFRAYLYEHTD